MKLAIALASILAACGSGDDGTTQKDAAGSGSGSGSANTVSVVACTGTPPVVSTESDTAMKYVYSTTTPPTVAAGSMVEFKMTPNHNVAPAATGNTDQGIKVDYGADVCLKFTKPGTYSFVCIRHGFSGSVVVN
jgi:plastocyanin